MPGLRNEQSKMQIGYVCIKGEKKLYVQCDGVRQYYGTLHGGKANKFLKMIERWDENGGNDGRCD